MKHFFVTAVALVLAGCQTMGPQARRQSAAEIMAADPTRPCVQQAATDPFVMAQLYAKTGVGGSSPPTLEMLADKTYPNEQQKRALVLFNAERQRCVQLGSAYRRANMPADVVMSLESNSQRLDSLLARLYAGDITFGEFNVARQDNLIGMRRELTQGDQQRAQQRAQEDAARRREVDAALSNFNNQLLLQQQINEANRPRTTNCQRLGNQVNCTTY